MTDTRIVDMKSPQLQSPSDYYLLAVTQSHAFVLYQLTIGLKKREQGLTLNVRQQMAAGLNPQGSTERKASQVAKTSLGACRNTGIESGVHGV